MNAEDARDLGHRFRVLQLARKGQLLVAQRGWTTEPHTARFRRLAAAPCPLNDQRPLELSDPGENGHHHPACRCCRVSPRLGQAFQSSSGILNTLCQIEQIPRAAGKAIEAGDHYQITRTEVIQEAFQLGPLPACARDFLCEDPRATGEEVSVADHATGHHGGLQQRQHDVPTAKDQRTRAVHPFQQRDRGRARGSGPQGQPDEWHCEQQLAIREKQGRAIFGVDMKIIDSDGKELPWDGKAYGELLVKGPWIINEYFKAEGGDPLIRDENGDGWFPTGDVATIDADGYLQITDRSKDVVKSGGEWISSIDIENIAVAHPAIAIAACIGVHHPKWDERPIVAVVKKPGAEVTREELLKFYEGKAAKWQIPDDVVFVEAIPLGATGKILKTKLRELLAGYKLPGL